MATAARRVLGVDTALRSTGIGVVELDGGKLRAVELGTVRNPARWLLSQCLAGLHRGITEAIDRTRPDAAAIEGVFFAKNVRTSVILGEARGAVIAACATAGVAVYEYPPRRVKQAVVGFGGAEKEQVRRMVMSLLGLVETPQEDAGDALAIAICHLHCRTQYAELAPKEI